MSSRELILLVLLETLAVGIVGGLLGFVPVRLLVSGMLYLSDATLLEALRLTLSAAGTVLGLTVGCSLLFGLFPAWMAARSTTMEVLRYDA
jgi:ABC-type antimicrobial peptide transport system permease subunit